jgi:hypothetical protein
MLSTSNKQGVYHQMGHRVCCQNGDAQKEMAVCHDGTDGLDKVEPATFSCGVMRYDSVGARLELPFLEDASRPAP